MSIGNPNEINRIANIAFRLLEIILLGAILYALATPEPILVVFGAPQVVRTTNAKIGVHTRLTDEVEEWKIKKTLELVRTMGSPWIVEYFPWGYYEETEGEHDWSHAEVVVDHAQRQGLTLIARLGFVPPWARPTPDSVTSFLDESRYEAFANFAAAFAKHFKGRVKYIILWNEPNVNSEWGFRTVDPAGYTRMLQTVYPRIKQVDPGIQVLAGALAPVLAPPGATDAMNDLEYLQRMYAAGAKDYFDALAIHAYGWTSPADEAPMPDRVNFRRAELQRAIMVKNGDTAKHAFITEGGWNDHPRWTKAVRPAERIEYTLRAYELARSWDWLDACAMWAFRYAFPQQTYQDYFGFVTPEFDLKPIYYEVQKYAVR